MGQTNLERTYFEPRVEILNCGNLARQEVSFTGYFRVGDTVDILDINSSGYIISILAKRTIISIEKDVAINLSNPVDTSAATVAAYAQVCDISDGQSAIDRLYHSPIDTTIVDINETLDTTVSTNLSGVLSELDGRITAKNVYPVITRSSGLISKIEYYNDITHSHKIFQRVFSRTLGSDQVAYITNIVTTFYNTDNSIDSIITSLITRTDDLITSCSNTFSTTE